jgi:hypothetical protein
MPGYIKRTAGFLQANKEADPEVNIDKSKYINITHSWS